MSAARRPTRQRLRRGTAGVVALVAAFLAPQSQAATVTLDGSGRTIFTAASGETNAVTLASAQSATGGVWIVHDDGAPVQALAGCTQVDANTAQCPSGWVTASLGDGNDRWQGYGLVYGGTGNDRLAGDGDGTRLEGEAGDDELLSGERCCVWLDGGPGNDTLLDQHPAWQPPVMLGGPGNDVLRGGPSANRLEGGPGSDVLDGGPGIDLITYSLTDTNRPVRITVDGIADDGWAGENDNVIGYEELYGSEAADVLTGDDSATRIFAGGGNDTIGGGGGDDEIDTGHGDDVVDAGAGNDVVRAGDGKATIRGGPGDDKLTTADYVGDTLDGGPGDDLLRGSAFADVLLGGDGTDTVDYFDGVHNWRVAVDLDGQAGDDGMIAGREPGYQGEKDTVGADVENVIGTGYADVLTGNAANNIIAGVGGGGDVIVGGGGFDTADYRHVVVPIVASLDGVANDGDPDATTLDSIAADVEGVVGGLADDVLVGNAADNLLDGGGGNDLLAGLAGSDRLAGGEGIADVVVYADRTDPVRIDLADPAPDGNALDGGGDLILADVEDVWGGAGADVLAGNDAGNALLGGPGADTLIGRGGFDLADYGDHTVGVVVDLDAQTGDDGAPGEGDTVGVDIEAVVGGEGNDVLTGNGGENLIIGLGGDDTIAIGDGVEDLADCGAGIDALSADRLDGQRGCETVQVFVPVFPLAARKPPAAPPPPVAASAPTIVTLARTLRRGTLSFRIGCASNATGGCRVRVGIRATPVRSAANGSTADADKAVALVRRTIVVRPAATATIEAPTTLPRRLGPLRPLALDLAVSLRAVETSGTAPLRQNLTLVVPVVHDEGGYRARRSRAGSSLRMQAARAAATRSVPHATVREMAALAEFRGVVSMR